MAIQQPQSTDLLSSPDHAKSHRVIAIDSAATDESFYVDSASDGQFANNVNIASGKKYKINNVDLGASDVGALATSGSVTGATSQSQVFTNGATLSNMTLGSVIYAGASGVLSQDNTKLFYDSTNKQLGVGSNGFLANGNIINAIITSTASGQMNSQNLSSTGSASSDLVATADTGTNATNYVDLGINSSVYNDVGYTITSSLDSYLTNLGGNLIINTGTATKNIVFGTGGNLSANTRMTLSDSLLNSLVNITTPNLNFGYTSTATTGGTTTLTVSSNNQQYFTGTLAQTVVMPVASTLTLGMRWRVINQSTGAVTVQSSGTNTILILAGGTSAIFTCILASGTTAASWAYIYSAASCASGKAATFSNSITFAGTDATTQTFQATDTIVGRATTDTLTNKRNQPRVYNTASNTSLTPEIATYSEFEITALAGAIAINNHSTSTPTAGEKMIITLLDNGVSRAISFGNKYRGLLYTLPTATTVSHKMVMGFRWDNTASYWDLISYGNQL